SSSFLYTSSLSTFFFKSPATTEIYTLSLHDALPISWHRKEPGISDGGAGKPVTDQIQASPADRRGFRARNGDALRRRHVLSHGRSEEHTSELQSRGHLVCRLLLEKKKAYMIMLDNRF